MATLSRDPRSLSPLERFAAKWPPERRAEAVAAFHESFDPDYRERVLPFAWRSLWARPNQLLPAVAWLLWIVRAGRGYGKTRTGAEAVREEVEKGRAKRVTIIAPTAGDGRDVMVEGESGLMRVHPEGFLPKYEPSKRRISWPNGAVGTIISAEDPDRLRGPQSDLVWGDEPASWKHGKEAWDNAMLGNRLGNRPRAILTGTPRPVPWLRDLEGRATTVVTTGSTYENLANLAPTFIELILERYEGTRLGQQELHALYLDDVEGALWALSTIEATRIAMWQPESPWASLVVGVTVEARTAQGLGVWTMASGERRKWLTYVGVDPPGETAECGIVVGTAPERGRASHDHAVILDDYSLAGPPEVWGAKVVEAYHKHHADGIVVESNQGGDMCRATIHAVDPNVKVEKVHAKVSKADRAEPVSTLYARGWIHHHGTLAALESQMTTWVPTEDKSPDRLDALVHLVTKLLKPTQIGRASVHSPVQNAS